MFLHQIPLPYRNTRLFINPSSFFLLTSIRHFHLSSRFLTVNIIIYTVVTPLFGLSLYFSISGPRFDFT
ncbi:hypothetical protein BDC45DRAFT_527261 [Circinella umbellata]|nr:hypothetical protein BDC45DRAFT_527261 [Circinella umbellata]